MCGAFFSRSALAGVQITGAILAGVIFKGVLKDGEIWLIGPIMDGVVFLRSWMLKWCALGCQEVGAELLINSWVLAMSGGGSVSWAPSTGAVWMTADGRLYAAIIAADFLPLKIMVLCSLAICSHSDGCNLEYDAPLQWLTAAIMRCCS
ncbi:hypothetical protein Nepgr_022953 [Nepenthes gracilis]|uniref:Uncharacterized protein n=1 Tax=Nepenthes gracilis TaxID=150966 RepID=A0AAD3T3G9_NEPGR|nr:hypothetical protein Nepgr_022953 [Nepenthes gracilis]